jgi:hypothetical protein
MHLDLISQTVAGNDVEPFTIGDDSFFAFAHRMVLHCTFAELADASAVVFKWNGTGFARFQKLIAFSCWGVTAFEFEGQNFLAVVSGINDYGSLQLLIALH